MSKSLEEMLRKMNDITVGDLSEVRHTHVYMELLKRAEHLCDILDDPTKACFVETQKNLVRDAASAYICFFRERFSGNKTNMIHLENDLRIVFSQLDMDYSERFACPPRSLSNERVFSDNE